MHIDHEIQLHIGECKEFGLTQADMEKYEESQGWSRRTSQPDLASTDFVAACTAYSRYVLDIGQSEDWLALQISLLPCLLGYGLIARRLQGLQKTDPSKQPNKYTTWINNYVAEDYTQAMDKGCGEFVDLIDLADRSLTESQPWWRSMQ